MRFIRVISLVVCLLSAIACVAQQQSQLTGLVTDPSAAAVPDSPLVVKNTATGVGYRTVATASGAYVFPILPPGPYTLTCEFAGFKKYERAGLILETGIVRTVDVQLEVGSASDTVTVTGRGTSW
jgi:Carboxypeptidase regulatory-like domain